MTLVEDSPPPTSQSRRSAVGYISKGALAMVTGVGYFLSRSERASAIYYIYCCQLALSPTSGCASWCSSNNKQITGWTCVYGGSSYYFCGECSGTNDYSCWTSPFYCSWYSRA